VFRRLLLTVGLAACIRAAAAAGSPASLPPLQFQGDESAAAVEGARAVFLNPAGLGVRYPVELFGSWTDVEGGGGVGRGSLGLGGFALQAVQVKDVAHSLGFTLAGGGERLRLGLGTDWRVDARTHGVVADHRLGLLSRPAPWLSLGAVADHLAEPAFGGARQGRVYTLALGLRPLALDRTWAHGWGTRLTLTSDLILADDGRWDQARARFGGELEALPGLLLRATVEDHRGLHVGITLRGVSGGVAAQTATVDGHRTSDTCWPGAATGAWRWSAPAAISATTRSPASRSTAAPMSRR